MNTKPFDLDKALKGEPVVLRNGDKAYIRHHETEFVMEYPLMGCGINEGRAVNSTWTECGQFYGDKSESKYDITGMWVKPLVFEHWNLLKEDIKYLAKDSDGYWYGYSRKPSKDGNWWNVYRRDGYYLLAALNTNLFPDCEWENSLIGRPENE